MNKFYAAIMLSGAMAIGAIPSYALTLDEAQAELAGMYCAGSICTTKTPGTKTIDLPDTSYRKAYGGRTTFKVISIPSHSSLRTKYEWAKDGEWLQASSDGIKHKTVVVDGGTATLPTCTTTTKTLTFHPNTSRALSWSVETETSTADGNC